MRRTVAGYAGEGDVHVYGQLLAARTVDDDGSVDVYPSIVDKLHSRESQDKCGG